MKSKSNALDICQIAMGAIIITICAWIMIPTAVPFTLQTFGIFTVLLIFGGKKGFLSVCLYILMGLIGIPVFSGFAAGPAVFMSVTGGYLIGFVLMALFYWFLSACISGKKHIRIVALIIGLVLCYLFGSVWLASIYGGPEMFYKALTVGVIPFIIPDIVKLVLAVTVSKMISKHMRF